jgi:hypothetical protein
MPRICAKIPGMSDAEPEPFFLMNRAPDLPHFGKHFAYHGPAGVLTFRIDIQDYSHDGVVMIGGPVIHGTESYETGDVQDCTGKPLTAFVTQSEYRRLSNAPLP